MNPQNLFKSVRKFKEGITEEGVNRSGAFVSHYSNVQTLFRNRQLRTTSKEIAHETEKSTINFTKMYVHAEMKSGHSKNDAVQNWNSALFP